MGSSFIGSCTVAELKSMRSACNALQSAISQRLDDLSHGMTRSLDHMCRSTLSINTEISSGFSSPVHGTSTPLHTPAASSAMHSALLTGELGLWQSVVQPLFSPTRTSALSCAESTASLQSTLWAMTEPSECGTFRGGTLQGNPRQIRLGTVSHSPPPDSSQRGHLQSQSIPPMVLTRQHRHAGVQGLPRWTQVLPTSVAMQTTSGLPYSRVAELHEGCATPIQEGAPSSEPDGQGGGRDLCRGALRGVAQFELDDLSPTLSREAPPPHSDASQFLLPAGETPDLSASFCSDAADAGCKSSRTRSNHTGSMAGRAAGEVVVGFPQVSNLPSPRRRDTPSSASHHGNHPCSLLSVSVTSGTVVGPSPGDACSSSAQAGMSLQAKVAAIDISAALGRPLARGHLTVSPAPPAIESTCVSPSSVQRIGTQTGRLGIPLPIVAHMADLGYHPPVRVRSSRSLRVHPSTNSPSPGSPNPESCPPRCYGFAS
jgi:hypothetical protein